MKRAGRVVTLHYRIGCEDGTELLSTFGRGPATLALGAGELAPGLERCVDEAELGERYVYLLEPGQAFGERRAELVQAMARTAFSEGLRLTPGAAVEFVGPGGERRVGVVLAATGDEVSVDFNHPLAGRRVRFEFKLVAVT